MGNCVPDDSNLFPADLQHRTLGEQSVNCRFVAGVQVCADHPRVYVFQKLRQAFGPVVELVVSQGLVGKI